MKMADKHADEGINELISGELTESDYDDERNYQEEVSYIYLLLFVILYIFLEDNERLYFELKL